jgi:lysyl-tRNA synthetase class 2
MDDTNSLIEQRKAKLVALRAKGIDPFQNKFSPAETCAAARASYVEGRETALAGRITAHRDMGKSMFIDIRDQSGRIQAYAQKNVLGDEQFHIFQHLDLGDFIGVNGTLFTTKTGEISVKIGGVAAAPSQPSGDGALPPPPFVILAKALRPPPAKYYGLEDTEIRYRQRYLDLIANPDVKDVMLKRSAIVHEIRNFFHERSYVEVETPAMQAIPGGAAAQPFKTFHNALGCEFYLRIALELYHKRLLVGGIDKLFEIGKNFRNEGLSRRHNPEFTMLEAYCAFGDYATMMETVESLITTVAQKVLGTLKIPRKQTQEVRSAIQSSLDILADLAELPPHLEQFEFVLKKLNAANSKIFPGLKACLEKVGIAPDVEVATEAKLLLDEGINSLIDIKVATVPQNNEQALTILQAFNRLESTIQALERVQKESVIDLSTPWRRAKYKDLVQEEVQKRTGRDNWFSTAPEIRRRVAIEDLKLGGDIGKEYEDFEVTNAVFSKLVEPNLVQPTFVTHLPKELVPLAKLSPDDPTTVEVFECCINGQEISPGYTEQNDS